MCPRCALTGRGLWTGSAHQLGKNFPGPTLTSSAADLPLRVLMAANEPFLPVIARATCMLTKMVHYCTLRSFVYIMEQFTPSLRVHIFRTSRVGLRGTGGRTISSHFRRGLTDWSSMTSSQQSRERIVTRLQMAALAAISASAGYVEGPKARTIFIALVALGGFACALPPSVESWRRLDVFLDLHLTSCWPT